MLKLLRRSALVPLVLVAIALLSSACTPEEIALVQRVVASKPTNCHQAVDRYWPASSRAWAHRIVNRESGGSPTAANKHSTARGCFQLMLSVHAGRFAKLGYSTSQWADPVVNVRVALDLYLTAGPGPWRL